MKIDLKPKDFDVVIVGGLGHVGLPLALVLADRGLKVCAYDTHQANAEAVRQGRMPFIEYDSEPLLQRHLNKNLQISSDLESVARADCVMIAVGTPVDEFHNPKTLQFIRLIENLSAHLSPDQLLIIRSTIFPRTCEMVLRVLEQKNKGPWKLAYCPERIAQGYAIKELKELPQIVAANTPQALQEASALFEKIAAQVISVSLEEAELAKLFSNAWRYIQFAVANQFYMISTELGVDFERVRKSMMDGYPRGANLPTAGFAAGPCLLKDTLQLFSFDGNRFILGQAAMNVNEGMPSFIVENLRKTHDLTRITVGILGMTFKANIDDTRDSLSYKLGKILRFHGASVLYSDEHAKDSTFVTKEHVAAHADVIIVGAPHDAYRTLAISENIHVIDLWNILKRPCQG